MARKTVNDERELMQYDDEALVEEEKDGNGSNDPVTMIAYMEQMKKELEERMRELDEREEQLASAQNKSDVPTQALPMKAVRDKEDAWKQTRSVFVPRAMGGEQRFIMVGVNGRRYQVPRGKTVEVPLPLYERITIMLEGEMKALEFQEKLRSDADERNVLKRLS